MHNLTIQFCLQEKLQQVSKKSSYEENMTKLSKNFAVVSCATSTHLLWAYLFYCFKVDYVLVCGCKTLKKETTNFPISQKLIKSLNTKSKQVCQQTINKSKNSLCWSFSKVLLSHFLKSSFWLRITRIFLAHFRIVLTNLGHLWYGYSKR